VADDVRAVDALGVERLEQIGDVALDVPGPVPGRAAVTAQVDRDPAPLGKGLLREAPIALAVRRDAVDRQRGCTVRRAVVMKIEDSQGALA
jgi:hypothetical protein